MRSGYAGSRSSAGGDERRRFAAEFAQACKRRSISFPKSRSVTNHADNLPDLARDGLQGYTWRSKRSKSKIFVEGNSAI